MNWQKIRIISQVSFFVFFILLFLQATYPYNPVLPSDFFLQWSPLVAVTTFLSSHYVITAMIPAAVIFFLTLFLGRFFCGWVCPLGSVIDFSDNRIKRKKSNKPASTHWRWVKFAILVFVLLVAAFGSQLAWFFDPLVIMNRAFTLVFYPLLVVLLNGIFGLFYDLNIFYDQVYSVQEFLQSFLLPLNPLHLRQGLVIAFIFGLILSLGFISRRFWCRNVCPLGALLGIFSRFRLVDREVNSENCLDCNICRHDCRMNAIAANYENFSKIECINAMECANVCPKDSIRYTFAWKKRPQKVDLKRRQFLGALGSGVAGYALLKIDFIDRNQAKKHVRPPGAMPEDQFLDRCIRCQECVRICSTTGGLLQPSWFQFGLEGLWTPVGDTRHGYCEYTCKLCGDICPTDAIHKLTLEEKKNTKIGTAFFDKSRCIPWYSGDNCMVCEEHCPTPEKAIIFREDKFIRSNGEVVVTKFPYVDEDLCIGCGICEEKCPVIGAPGIFVTSEREQRYIEW